MTSWDRALSNLRPIPSPRAAVRTGKVDAVDRLSPEKQYKFRQFLEMAQTAQADLSKSTELESDLRNRRHQAQARVSALEGDQGMRALFGNNHPTMVDARQKVKQIDKELEYRIGKRNEHSEQAKPSTIGKQL